MYVVQPLGCSPFPLPAIHRVCGAPTGRRIRGGAFTQGKLGSCGASLTLGYIRLPLRGTKWTDSQEKIEVSAKKLRF